MASCHRPFIFLYLGVTNFTCPSFYHCFCSINQDLPRLCSVQSILYLSVTEISFFMHIKCQFVEESYSGYVLCIVALIGVPFLPSVFGVNFKWKKLVEAQRTFSFIQVTIPVTFRRIYVLFLYTKNWNLFPPITLSLWVDIH